ncbi:Golgi complex component 7-domain-containing protein [Parasitella parasitica]|nr:Golgi complex component 7-domain-containing protein [Parasitella parasitica]
MSSVVIDTNEFSDPDFNPKKWINSVLKPSTVYSQKEDDEDGGAKHSTILVTKLQIASDSTSRQFDQLSSSVIKSMPRLLYDLKIIADDAKSTHQGVEAVKKDLGLIEGDTEVALEKLRRPHIAKTRMEECRMLLLEKSDHLNKIKQEQEKAKQEAAAAAAKLLAEEEEHRKQSLLAEQEEEKAREDEAKMRKEQEDMEASQRQQKQAEEEEQKEIDEVLEYGHVQLPPLRQPPPKKRTLQQIQNAAKATAAIPENPDDNNGYLQQISGSVTPQVSNVFKRIGVPLDKFWS